MLIYIIGDSIKANALGRALSLALTARELGDIRVRAVDDGREWVGSGQFPIEVRAFSARRWRSLVDEIRVSAGKQPVLVWFSKGTSPLPKIARQLTGNPNIQMIADFDDDDVAIMEAFRSASFRNFLTMPEFRRKSPRRLATAQRKIFGYCHGATFSSPTLREVYASRWGQITHSAIVPHTRMNVETKRPERTLDGRSLTLGFLGTMRDYKGATELVNLMRSDVDIRMISFQQEWNAPSDVSDRWTVVPALTSLPELYAQIDFLALPMQSTEPAARHQLPAKLVDAAVNGCPVAATSTSPIEDFVAGRYVRILDWADTSAVVRELRSSDPIQLSECIRAAYEESFSPKSTSKALANLIDSWVREPQFGRRRA